MQKDVTMRNPITRWFDITQYNNKKAMTISNLVETTWLVQYLLAVEITYDRGGNFLGNNFKSIMIEQ